MFRSLSCRRELVEFEQAARAGRWLAFVDLAGEDSGGDGFAYGRDFDFDL